MEEIEKYEDLPDWAKVLVDASRKNRDLPEEERKRLKEKYKNIKDKMNS